MLSPGKIQTQGWVCLHKCTCCHTKTDAADQTGSLIQSQYADLGPTSPSTDAITQVATRLHLHLPRSLADRWGTAGHFTTSSLHSSWFSPFRSMMFHSRPVYTLTSSSNRFLCLPLRLPPWTVPRKIVLASPDDGVRRPYRLSWRPFTEVKVSIRPDGVFSYFSLPCGYVDQQATLVLTFKSLVWLGLGKVGFQPCVPCPGGGTCPCVSCLEAKPVRVCPALEVEPVPVCPALRPNLSVCALPWRWNLSLCVLPWGQTCPCVPCPGGGTCPCVSCPGGGTCPCVPCPGGGTCPCVACPGGETCPCVSCLEAKPVPVCPALEVEPVPVCPALEVEPVPVCPALEVEPVPVCPALEVEPVPVCPALQVEPVPVSLSLSLSLYIYI